MRETTLELETFRFGGGQPGRHKIIHLGNGVLGGQISHQDVLFEQFVRLFHFPLSLLNGGHKRLPFLFFQGQSQVSVSGRVERVSKKIERKGSLSFIAASVLSGYLLTPPNRLASQQKKPPCIISMAAFLMTMSRPAIC